MRTLNDAIGALSNEARKAVENKARRLIRAETLRQIRSAAGKTQKDVSDATGISQFNVSRLERRDDMLLSTLSSYIEGLGGKLQIIARMPGQEDIELDVSGRPARRRKADRAA